MPIATYQQLLVDALPRRIDSTEQHKAISARFGDLLAKRKRTEAEDELMDLLGVLIEDYDRRNAMPPDDSTPAEILAFLLEHSEKTPEDLLPVLGERCKVDDVLAGRRGISTEQAKELAKMFSVRAGLFL